jgi:hypothetical protein
MGKAIGEGFVDHQSGITHNRTRSADAAIGRPNGMERSKAHRHDAKPAGTLRLAPI